MVRIKREGLKAGPSKKLSTPKKKKAGTLVKVDDFDRQVIRNVIQDFYLVRKQVPTAPKLLAAIKEKIEFPYKLTSLRRLLKQMGFKWKKSQAKRKVLIERPSIVAWRSKYLKAMKFHRQENRTIVYLDETWVDNNLTFKKCWQSDDIPGVLTDTSSTNRLIVVSAGSANGFVKGAELIFKAGQASGDYHGQMNSENYEKWVREKLIPNLPPRSVLVLDNAPYHNIQLNKVCTVIFWVLYFKQFFYLQRINI